MELIITEKNTNFKPSPTICLNMIVKNESKIITRMFDAVIAIIDYYCICDTGSTDNTVDLITTYFLEKGITGKIVHEPFKNFSHNRNVALQACTGMSDYVLLLDADMILKIGETFVKNSLKEDYYHIFQGNENFYYQNTRLVKNNGLFSYAGVTHEHINVPAKSIGGKVFDKKDIFIHDIGDGGAKSDKFKRDIRLLEQGLIDEPNNTRYLFYLGNSYRDNGDYDKAIETYKKQLTANAWVQEKYCACLSIGNIYHKKDDKNNAAKFWVKTSEYDNERIEGIVKAMDYFRNKDENVMVNLLYHKYKGYKRNVAEGKLFVEQDKYGDVLEYNNSISAYYANDKESGYICCKQILLNGIMDIGSMKRTLDNLIFYKDFLSKDTQEERAKLFKSIDTLLGETKLNMKKNENEIWRMLNSDIKGEDSINLTEISLEKPKEMNLEQVYQQIKIWRIDGKSHEALELYNSISKEHSKYKEYLWQLAYEYSVFAYYTGIRNINEQLVTILNKCEDSALITSVLSNIKFYPDVLKAEKVYDYTFTLKHKINDVEYNFNSSSSCIIPYKEGYLLNVRLVNYIIDSEGAYGGYDKHIISLYKSITLSKDFTKIVETLIDVHYVDRRYIGIEDIKIFQESASADAGASYAGASSTYGAADKILFTGTGYHNNNSVGVVCGQYSEVNYVCGKPLNLLEIKPAFNLHSGCEKNWTYVTYKGETHVVYSWFPLKICKVNKTTGNLDLVEERTMPAIFKNARGSSCASKHTAKCGKVENWFVVHLVSYEKPRYYYHMLVVLDNHMDLLRYSAPFKFEGECIEYCIGLIVEAERVIIPYSTMDRTTKVAVYSKEYIESKMIYYIINIMNFTKDDIITTDKYLNAFVNLYYKTDVIYNAAPINWRNKVHNPPKKNMDIIITGHSDAPINDTYVDLYNPKIWYTVNKQTTKPNVYALPLGITNNTNESLIHQIYGDLDCMITVMNEQKCERTNLVYMNFNININTYPQERQMVYKLLCNKTWVTLGENINTLEGRTNFLREIKCHDFVLCPRGNGIDTHRLWETLYMGSIPIVKRDIAFKEFEDLPICFINDWTDINETFLRDEKNRISNTTYNLEKLKIDYWLDKIKSSINSNNINNANKGMKLTTVLASTNNNPCYYKFIPSQILFWKHFNIKFIAIFVGEKIPDELEEYKEHIILWDKPTNCILHTAYIAQNIRIYYPALLNLPVNEMVMITDMDMLPTNDKFYKSGLEQFTQKDFIYYRHIEGKQIYMCYNAAHPSVWSEVFNIKSEKDIENELINNYNKQYDGHPGSSGWYSDQELMYNKLINYPHLKVLNRPLKRLEMYMYNKHLENGDEEFISLYDDAHFHRNYDSNKNYILNAKTQILSTVQINNLLCNNVLNAVIITGQFRTFEKILKSLVENIVVPNNAVVFICCETDNKEKLDKILNKYPEINIGGIITEPSFRNGEFNSILNMIIKSNRKGLSHEVFERAKKADGINWNINYIETSGTILQYYQFWKIWHVLLEYECKNKCKFENIIRTRTDVFISKKINISNVFEEGGYIQNLYNKSLLLDNSIYFDKLTNIIHKPCDTIITLSTEQVWIGKRGVFDCLSNILFHYGLWDSGHSFSFNSETNFHEFCKNYNIYHIGIQEKEDWPLYFYGNDDVNKYLFGICRF